MTGGGPPHRHADAAADGVQGSLRHGRHGRATAVAVAMMLVMLVFMVLYLRRSQAEK
jgi:ABC-type sugar transport system permease subunit